MHHEGATSPPPAAEPPSVSGQQPHGSEQAATMPAPATFYFGYQNLELLYPGFVITSPTEMIVLVLLMFLLALGYEKLKVARGTLLDKAYGAPWRRLSWPHLQQTLLYVLQVFLSYVLMLTIMTYNAYLALAVAVGVGVGYLRYYSKNSVPSTLGSADHCH